MQFLCIFFATSITTLKYNSSGPITLICKLRIKYLTFRRCPFNFHNFFCYRLFWNCPVYSRMCFEISYTFRFYAFNESSSLYFWKSQLVYNCKLASEYQKNGKKSIVFVRTSGKVGNILCSLQIVSSWKIARLYYYRA